MVTLRTRLTVAFLAVVLGPVLLGAVFVGVAVTTLDRSRAQERLDRAASMVRDRLDVLCGELRAGASAAAQLVGAAPSQRSSAAARPGPAGGPAATDVAVQLRDAADHPTGTGAGTPPLPWAVCGQAGDSGRYTALAARVEVHDAQGVRVGYAYAVRVVDGALLTRLAAGTGASVTTGPAAGRYSVAVEELAVSVPPPVRPGLLPLLATVVLLAAAAAVAVAWWLARGTTRPLVELAGAASRVADGDLSARVPVRTRDEVGRLAATFNRMTREMQGYVTALTASRDQLRGQLGLLGDTLSSTHDLARILDVILQTARAATAAEGGVVLLVEDGALVGPGVRVPLGAGLLGAVAGTGVARRGRLDRDGPVLHPDEPRCRTYMAVPFSVPESVTGVLALYDRVGGDEFDDADLVTLRSFASRAAIAVENVRVHEEAQRLSHTDALTGLFNYRTMKDSLRREVERAVRFGHPLCVLTLDLDRFKEVNDTYGHAAGDVVLVETARRIRSVIRDVDLAFRRGGEEFVVLLPETDALGGSVVAQRLGIAIRSAPVVVPDKARIPVTVSIGVALYPEHGGTGPAVLEVSDDALYAAKAAGRDQYQLAPLTLAGGAPGGASCAAGPEGRGGASCAAGPEGRGGAPGGPDRALPAAGR